MSRADDKKTGAVRKRQQIQDSGKQMFLWVAGMSAVVGAALVVSWFVWQIIVAKNNVISEKNVTVDTLKANNAAVPEIRDAIRVRETSTALLSVESNYEHRPLQLVLDALPADPNPLALGASLQERLVQGIDGLKMESLSVTPTGEMVRVGRIDRSATGDDIVAEPVATATDGDAYQIGVTMQLTAPSAEVLDEFLKRLERSIRVIDIDTLQVERSISNFTMNISAHGYYSPERTIELTTRRVTQ